jgi:hypothetical protein
MSTDANVGSNPRAMLTAGSSAMKVLTLYTPAAPCKGPPSPEQLANK